MADRPGTTRHVASRSANLLPYFIFIPTAKPLAATSLCHSEMLGSKVKLIRLNVTGIPCHLKDASLFMRLEISIAGSASVLANLE